MKTSKQIIDITQLSRATLNNYISLGLIARPIVMNPGKAGGGARQLGYFPDDTIQRINTIRQLKSEGMYMGDIVNQMKQVNEVLADDLPAPEALKSAHGSGRALDGASLTVTVDQISHPAYMVNYNFEIVWFNEQARTEILGGFEALPPNSEDRGILQMICRNPDLAAKNSNLLAFHMGLAKGRLPTTKYGHVCKDLPPDCAQLFAETLSDCNAPQKAQITDTPIELVDVNGKRRGYHAYASFFREGILLVYVPRDTQVDTLLGFLSRRDQVIRDLLRKRLPVLTPLAVIVADLQNSVKICSELPPEEYFELINQIWSAMGPIFRKYYGTHGKHVGDGMVYYFFPQPDSSYILNALLCAYEVRLEMQKISKAWQLRKNWLNELFLNIGVNEGEEWLGTFQSANSIEFAVLGDTINHAGRLSDFARHGKIWSTKSLVGKMSSADRARVRYGITRDAGDGRNVFIASSFSLLAGMIDLTDGRYEKFRDISGLTITEIVDVGMEQ